VALGAGSNIAGPKTMFSKPFLFCTGFDAAGYLTEETERADVNGPMAILLSLGGVSIFGWIYILALTFSIQGDPVHLFSPDNETAGMAQSLGWSLYQT
jgi:amino acid transporter